MVFVAFIGLCTVYLRWRGEHMSDKDLSNPQYLRSTADELYTPCCKDYYLGKAFYSREYVQSLLGRIERQ